MALERNWILAIFIQESIRVSLKDSLKNRKPVETCAPQKPRPDGTSAVLAVSGFQQIGVELC